MITTRKRLTVGFASLALAGGLAGGILSSTPAGAAQPESTVKAADACGYKGGHPTLYIGSNEGKAIKHAQCLLSKVWGWGDYVKIDGWYGEKTAHAVKVSQQNCNKTRKPDIAVDGEVGPNTWKVLHPDTNKSFCQR
ncbi:peptidoglycan-binding domain-containing protein [Streptomyces luteocolor]|uniref:peptidoglycan-binding domain-containing protein n=1 Tax=Streptomyces luteocolor TaxID=285500 RepID=UPI000853115B|nr:peptidoglycan-binding domain-containing protein [Streptomyces luteocolor]